MFNFFIKIYAQIKFKLKKVLICLLGEKKSRLILRYLNNKRAKRGNLSFGQEGEDRVLLSLLYKVYSGKITEKGFYIDVGAHHPYRFSNTNIFYKLGWNGINIDPTPGSMTSFMTARPNDINLEAGIGLERSKANFYIFNEGALNTFDQDLALSREIPPWKIERTVEVPVFTLAQILEKHLPIKQSIDFLTVDVEGLDLMVLQSNDWIKFRPKVVVVETFGENIHQAIVNPVSKYLEKIGYIFYSKTVNTSFFVDSKFIAS